VIVGEFDRLAVGSSEEFLFDDGELISGVFGGCEVGLECDAVPVGLLALGHFEVGFKEVLVLASQRDWSHLVVGVFGVWCLESGAWVWCGVRRVRTGGRMFGCLICWRQCLGWVLSSLGEVVGWEKEVSRPGRGCCVVERRSRDSILNPLSLSYEPPLTLRRTALRFRLLICQTRKCDSSSLEKPATKTQPHFTLTSHS
jgi:hypothetical protein